MIWSKVIRCFSFYSLLWLNILNSQNVSRSINFANLTHELALGIVEVEGNFIISSIVRCKLDEDVPSEFCTCMLKINPKGEIIWKRLMEFDTDHFSQISGTVNMISRGDSIIVSGITYKDSIFLPRIYIAHKDGYLINQIDLNTKKLFWHNNMIYSKGNYILLNSLQDSFRNPLYYEVLRLNDEFEILNSSIIKPSIYTYSVGNIITVSNNDIIISSASVNSIYLASLNNNLLLNWAKEINTATNTYLYGKSLVCNGEEDNFYCTSLVEEKLILGQVEREGLGFIYFSKQGSIIWKLDLKGWFTIECEGLLKLNNDDLLAFGTVNTKQGLNAGWISRISKEGNIIWNKVIMDKRLKFVDQTLTSVAIASKNSDFVFTGKIVDTFPNHYPSEKNNNIWFLTLDKNGCYNGDCSDTIIIKDSIISSNEVRYEVHKELLEFYPNPIQDYLNINFINQEERLINIYANNGQLIKTFNLSNERNKINLITVIPGNYYLTITNSKGQISNQIQIFKK